MESKPAPQDNELHRARQLQLVCSALVQSRQVGGLFQQIVNAAVTLMDSQAGSLQTLNCHSGELELSAWKGLHPTSTDFWRKVRSDSQCASGAALASGQRVIVPDVEHCAFMVGAKDLEAYRRSQIRSCQSTPLVSLDGELLGMLSTHWSSPHTPSEADLGYFDVLVRLTADLIEQKRVDQQLRETEAWLRGQKEAFQAAMTRDLLPASLEPLVQTAVQYFNGDARAAFYLADYETATLHHITGIAGTYAQEADDFKIGADSLACGLAMHRGEAVITPDVTCEPRWEPWRWLAHEHGYRGCWSFPIRTTNGPALGTLALYFTEPRHATPRDLELLGVLTHAATIIISRHQEVAERGRAEAALQEAQTRLQLWNAELEVAVHAKTVELIRSQDDLRALATEVSLDEHRERKRLATELHDHLQQLLVLGKIRVAQKKRLAPGNPAGDEFTQQIDDILSQALTYTRTLVCELSPPVLRDHGLFAGLKWLGEQMTKHDLRVTVKVPEDEIKLPEDQQVLLFQSVRELLINSSKYGGTGEAMVKVEKRVDRLLITVMDQGKGFDLAAAAAAIPSDGLSSKFGLFSVRERMKALGGSFDLQSVPDQGTTATVTLLLPEQAGIGPASSLSVTAIKDSERISSTYVQQASASEVSRSPSHSRIRVLLVDDHAMVRQGLKTILGNYSDLEIVGEVSNGEEALAQSMKLRPSVVVMDLNMPGMNGIEATGHFKARYPEIKVIGISVNVGEENQAAMKNAGAVCLIPKEAAVEALYDTIKNAIHGSHQSQSTEQYDLFAPTVLLIDGNEEDRREWAQRLKSNAPEYVLIEAPNGETGLQMYRSHNVSCVVLELDLPDISGSRVLVNLVPRLRKKEVAVIMLTRRVLSQQMVNFLRSNGAHACLFKSRSSGKELSRHIEKSMGALGPMHKEPISEL